MNARGLLSWFLSPTFDAYGMSDFDVWNVAKMICLAAETERKVTQRHKEREAFKLSIPAVNTDLYQEHPTLRPVLNILSILEESETEFIKYFLMHGSLADLRFVPGWSDLDTWVVISDQVLKKPDSLLFLKSIFVRLNQELLKVDSIAHHGFILVLESDLSSYNDALMPIEVLERAVSLMGEVELNIHRNSTKSDWVFRFQSIRQTFTEFKQTGVFKHHPYGGEYLSESLIRKGEGMYQLKYLISWVLSFPSLYYSALGKPVYKSESFGPFSKTFGAHGSIVEEFSAIRNDWSLYENFPYKPNLIPDWLMDRLPDSYIDRTVCLLDEMIGRIENQEGKGKIEAG